MTIMKKIGKYFTIVTICTLNVLLLSLSVANAQEDIVKYRQDAFKAMSGNARTINRFIQNNSDKELIAKELTALLQSTEIASKSFKTDVRTSTKTKASKDIWLNKEKFDSLFQDALSAIKKTQTVLDQDDAMAFKTAFGGVSKTCSSCHSQFRLKNKQ